MNTAQSPITPLQPAATPFRRKLVAVAVAQAMVCAVSPVNTATINVTHGGDIPSRGTCTLRDAIASANTDAVVATCAAGNGTDIITFDPGIVPGIITLGGSELRISSPLTIQGPGANQLTISGNNTSRIFNIDDGSFARIAVTLDGLTLSGGTTTVNGGAVLSREDLLISDSTLSNNSADNGGGAIFIEYEYATTTLTNTTLSNNSADNGGGLANFNSNASLTDCIVSGNSALNSGGGLANFGSLAILNLTNSTVSGNSADLGGGLFNAEFVSLANSTLSGNTARYGGGLYNSDFALLTNCTLSGNSASDGGGLFTYGNTTLTNCTLTGNTAAFDGGGIGAPIHASNLHFANTIIANNVAAVDCAGFLIILTNLNNLGCGGMFTGDPLLGPLQDNGGPTFTHAVLSGSPVIDAGDQSTCDSAGMTTDQTGMPRSLDGDGDGNVVCDIGAFEFVDVFAPLASLSSAPDVNSAGAASYDLVIDYSDADSLVDFTSFDSDDITVTPGPLGVNGVSNAGASVTYTLTPPGGSWNSADNGSFTITLNPDQVFDNADPVPNAAAAGTLGGFSVGIAEIDVTGNAISIADGDITPDVADGTDFGDLAVGASGMRTFTIANTGLGTINITGPVSVTGSGFSVSQPGSLVLGAGASTTIEVSFNPTVGGVATSTVTIPNDDPDEDPYTFRVAANAVAPEIDVTGNAISIADGDTTPSVADDTDFGDVAVGASGMRTFTITNTGLGTINITDSVSIVGAGFSVSQPASLVLGAGASTTIEVSFNSTVEGVATSTVTIPNDDPDENPYTFAVAGNGVVLTDPIFADGFESAMP